MIHDENLKRQHIQSAGDYISRLSAFCEQIDALELRDRLFALIRQLRDLRDLQYLFESGEPQLKQLYDRYLPYLNTILVQYVRMQHSGSYEAIQKLRHQLDDTLALLTQAVKKTAEILPEDEIAEARAEAQAKKKLEEQHEKVSGH